MFKHIIQFIQSDFPLWDGSTLIGYSLEYYFSNFKVYIAVGGFKQYSFRVQSVEDARTLSKEITRRISRSRRRPVEEAGDESPKRARRKPLKSLNWTLPVYLNVFFKQEHHYHL